MTKFFAIALALLGAPGFAILLHAKSAPELRPDEMADLTAAELRAEPENPQPGEEVRAILTLHNNSVRAQEHIPVILFAGSERVATADANVAAGESKPVALSWKAAEPGSYVLPRASILIELFSSATAEITTHPFRFCFRQLWRRMRKLASLI